MSNAECVIDDLDPMAPDAMCKAVNSGCLHCIMSVISQRELAKGKSWVQVSGNLLQVVSEITGSAVMHGIAEEKETRQGMLDLAGRLFDEAMAGYREGDKPR